MHARVEKPVLRIVLNSFFVHRWSLAQKGRKYVFVCKLIVDRYAMIDDPDELIRTAMNSLPDRDIFVKLTTTSGKIYIAAGFHDRAKVRDVL